MEPENDHGYADFTSGAHTSFWKASAKLPTFEKLESNVDAEVAIVGGGIAGLTTAYLLLKSGRQVILFEDGELASGETGRTTAHLTYSLDDRYYFLEETFGKEKTRLAAKSHAKAIDTIEAIVREEQIECDFRRLPGYLFCHSTDSIKNLHKEFDASRNAGLPTSFVKSTPGISGGRKPRKHSISATGAISHH